jgi:hypothetical protein
MIQGWEHLVITICVCYILYYVINNSKKAKAQDKRIAKLDAGQMTDWDEYLAKLCRITGKNAHELMTIAAQEAGLNFNKARISKDFRAFIHSEDGELPGYVILFLKRGKDKIDSIEEGPGRTKNQVPPLF